MVRNEVLDLHLYVWNDNYISLSKQNELQKNKTNSPDIFKQFLHVLTLLTCSYYVYNINYFNKPGIFK